ncbi:hypothetical protein LWI28_016747 [Acer negundo]|uniref:NAC domain-containing protein n=1 Tax=Acer negundo TaxID=4023 RepID=A0AAD5J6E9_ACENE|nr:hypothetical protein LWI28_016747 [Acer negundo]
MNNISMVEAKLPPGFRFHPRDDELVCDYLINKITHSDTFLFIEVDLNKCEPWDIPAKGESEVMATGLAINRYNYGVILRDRKYATGLRTNRATASGYWKATGKDRAVHRKGKLVGMRKTLVFYQGRAPKGTKTDWVMHEFRLEASPFVPSALKEEDWVLCRVLYKNRQVVCGHGGQMGSCYDDTAGSNSSCLLPPLMDSYITFDPTPPNNLGGDEQVPCFSLFSHVDQQPNTTKLMNSSSSSSCSMFDLDPHAAAFSCDNKEIKAVLNHFNNKPPLPPPNYYNYIIKGSSSSSSSLLGEHDQPTLQSYLSHVHEVGMPNFWNNRYS